MPSLAADARNRDARLHVLGLRSPMSAADAILTRRARSSADRASDFGSEGRGFESLRARHVLSRDMCDT